MGASHHMTGILIFSSYKICSGWDEVQIANGSVSSIGTKEMVLATSNILLLSILLIPKFTLNFLSTSHIIRTVNCSVRFLLYLLGLGDEEGD